MAGIEHDPLSDIQNIRRLLDVYRPGFAFLKELVQNADDAGASRLLLFWFPGIREAVHPLLQGPALVSINNSGFTESDKHSLLRMGLGNKGGKSGKIGKFGLGTKSIFHVAEAFYFLESGGDPELRDILNPWSPRCHSDWDDVTEGDWSLLQQVCRNAAAEFDPWFALWIPLRRQEVLDGVEPIRSDVAAFPGKSSHCPVELLEPLRNEDPRLGLVLPLLRHLERVEFSDGATANHVFEIDRDRGTIRHDELNTDFFLACYEEEGLAAPWKALPAWPRVFEIGKDGKEETLPDKAEWNHAVVLATTPAEKGRARLRIYWSVFLPVGNETWFDAELPDCDQDISLFLHGFFFLNDSRTQIRGLNEHFPTGDKGESVGVCLQWNHELASSSPGLLPAVLPALHQWFEQKRLSEAEYSRLIRQFRISPLWQQFREAITNRGSLLFGFHKGDWKWHWVEPDREISLIPRIEKKEDLELLQALTGRRGTAEAALVLAVDFPEYRALYRSDILKFGEEGLISLREIIGEKPEPSDDEAALLVRILGSLPDTEPPDCWNDVPLYRARSCGKAEWRRVSLVALAELVSTGDVFKSDDHHLAPLLANAAGDETLPVILDRSAPTHLAIRTLTIERAANWLLGRGSLSERTDHRLGLLKKFAALERFGPEDLKAIRYLIHANPQHRADDESELFFQVGERSEIWAEAFRLGLEAQEATWRLVDGGPVQSLSDTLKSRTKISACDREGWPRFVRSFGEQAASVDFSKTTPEILNGILRETPEEELSCLRILRMHRLPGGEMVSASDTSVWLDGAIEVPDDLMNNWNRLRRSARIVVAASDPSLHHRQKLVFDGRVLDESGALKLVVDSGLAQECWKLILHFLGAGTPRADAIEALRAARWLPSTSVQGERAWLAPSGILHLKGLESCLDSVLGKIPECDYVSSSRLIDEVSGLRGWNTLSSQVFPSVRMVFEKLEEVLEYAPDSLRLGSWAVSNDGKFDGWMDVVSKSEAPELFASLPFFTGIRQNESWQTFLPGVVAALAVPFDGEEADRRYLQILGALQRQHQASGRDEADKVLAVFALYLDGIYSAGLWESVRTNRTLELVSQKGTWKSTSHLAAPCEGVDKDSLLRRDLAVALGFEGDPRGIPDSDDEGTIDRGSSISAAESASNLRSVLDELKKSLPSKAVGILPALLGDEEPMARLAEELLDGISIASIRDDLIPADMEVHDRSGGFLRERCKRWSFRVKKIAGKSVPLDSLAGSLFEAPLEERCTSILLPNQNGQLVRWCGGSVQEICVLSPDRLIDLPETRLRDILLQSLRDLFSKAYDYLPSHLEVVFDKYAKLGQLSLGVARQEILRSADMQLQLLGVRPPSMEEARELSTEARARYAEAEAGVGDAGRLRQEGKKAEAEARKQFFDALEHCPETQQILVDGLRRKIGQQQYDLDSIPFELLQNADDAATELLTEVNVGETESPMVTKFVLRSEQDRLLFFYGGRPINDACGRTGPGGDRWRRDLVKMLLLSGSDKNTEGEEEVTGKFGLGFKSVFLLSTEPKIMSASLAFEIVGGIWPRPLGELDIEEIKSTACLYFGNFPRGTAVCLEANSTVSAGATRRFRDLAHLAPIFLRSLRTVEISGGGDSAVYRWNREAISHSKAIRHGTVSSMSSERSYLELKNEHFQWLFGLESGGLKPLPEEVPWLWVAVPTREEGLGFAVNAQFALDPGRTRLSKHKEDETGTNRRLFYEGADLLEKELSHLAEEKAAISELGIRSVETFWKCLWDLMVGLPRAESDKSLEGAEQLNAALWPRDCSAGYAKLIFSHRIIPTKLPTSMAGLVSLEELRFSVSGWLATTRGSHCLSASVERELLGALKEAGCCSALVAQELKSRLDINLSRFRLKDLLQGEDPDHPHVKPKVSNLVSEGLFGENDESDPLLKKVLEPDELSELESAAKSLRFRSRAGTWEPAEDLLAAGDQIGDSDEASRSAFAPANRVLSAEYSSLSALLLKALRQRLNAASDEMATWIVDASSDELLEASLAYLATGEMKQEIALALGPEWLQEISGGEVFNRLDETTRESVKLVFGMARQADQLRKLQGDPGWLFPSSDPEEEAFAGSILEPEDVLRVWNEPEALRLFTLSGPLREQIVPGAEDDEVMKKVLSDAASLPGKVAWYRLLCLGCTLGMPRGRQPAHGVKRLWEGNLGARFWSDSIPESLSVDALDAVQPRLDLFFGEIIDRYYKNENASGEDADFWRRVFYDFRKMHHFVFRNHLPDTILEFAGYDEVDGSKLIGFLRSGHIPPEMQDPNHPRFRGVIGQSMKAPLLFVMRELSRLGILDQRFVSASFYMNSPARRVAYRLEWISDKDGYGRDFQSLVETSELVYQRAKDELPELLGFYDLPLQLFAVSPNR